MDQRLADDLKIQIKLFEGATMFSLFGVNHYSWVDEVEGFALDFVILSAYVLKLLAGSEDKFFTDQQFLRVDSFS